MAPFVTDEKHYSGELFSTDDLNRVVRDRTAPAKIGRAVSESERFEDLYRRRVARNPGIAGIGWDYQRVET